MMTTMTTDVTAVAVTDGFASVRLQVPSPEAGFPATYQGWTLPTPGECTRTRGALAGMTGHVARALDANTLDDAPVKVGFVVGGAVRTSAPIAPITGVVYPHLGEPPG